MDRITGRQLKECGLFSDPVRWDIIKIITDRTPPAMAVIDPGRHIPRDGKFRPHTADYYMVCSSNRPSGWYRLSTPERVLLAVKEIAEKEFTVGGICHSGPLLTNRGYTYLSPALITTKTFVYSLATKEYYLCSLQEWRDDLDNEIAKSVIKDCEIFLAYHDVADPYTLVFPSYMVHDDWLLTKGCTMSINPDAPNGICQHFEIARSEFNTRNNNLIKLDDLPPAVKSMVIKLVTNEVSNWG